MIKEQKSRFKEKFLKDKEIRKLDRKNSKMMMAANRKDHELNKMKRTNAKLATIIKNNHTFKKSFRKNGGIENKAQNSSEISEEQLKEQFEQSYENILEQIDMERNYEKYELQQR